MTCNAARGPFNSGNFGKLISEMGMEVLTSFGPHHPLWVDFHHDLQHELGLPEDADPEDIASNFIGARCLTSQATLVAALVQSLTLEMELI